MMLNKEADWQAAWALHLTQPAESFARATTARDAARAAGDAHAQAWAALGRALAGYAGSAQMLRS